MTSADVVFVADRVVTMTPGGRPDPTVVAVRHGLVVAVGDVDLLDDAVGPATRIERFPGATITPGLIDAHTHPLLGVRRARGVDLGAVTDLHRLIDVIRREAARAAASEWLFGWNLGYDVFGGAPISAAAFEPALGGRPMLLLLFDGHTALASAAALRVTDRRLPGTDTASFVVDGDGVLTGEVREESAIAAVLAAGPPLADADVAARAGEVLQEMAALGYTGACLMDGDRASFELLDRLESIDDLPLRIVAALQHDPEFGAERMTEHLSMRDRHGRRWRGGLIKLYADGVIDTGTGWLAHPDSHHEGTIGLWADSDAFRRTVLGYSRAGFQIATHAIGDAAIAATIDAYAEAGAGEASRTPHRIEHLELLADRDVDRLADLGIMVSMQPSHMQWRRVDGSDSWAARVGGDRMNRAWRTGDILRAGIPLAFGSDWPVAGFDPREIMAWARLRRAPGDRSMPAFEPEQATSATRALAGLTSEAARAQGDHDLGVLDAGRRADLAVWAEDPLRVDADDLTAVPIQATFVSGTPTFRVHP